LILRFQKPQQVQNFHAELIVHLENLGRLAEGHPSNEDELVRGPQGSARLPSEPTRAEGAAVDPANTRGVTVNAHIAGNILRDLRLAANVAVAPDRRKLVNANFL
jgi:hypothetical protein